MDSLEPKKLALLRILQILQKETDEDHPLMQEAIGQLLERNYDIVLERKAIARNIHLLQDAGYEIAQITGGYYLQGREFDDAELKLLIDGVLCSHHITARHSKDLIEKLCGLSNRYFRSHVRNIYAVNEWNKADNKQLFLTIGEIDSAIEQGRQVQFNYNMYGTDGKLHHSSYQRLSPYQLLLHNQRYYVMGYSEYWGEMSFRRLDHITNIQVLDKPAFPLHEVPGYANGIDYKKLSTALPYMFSDKPEKVELIISKRIIDQVVEWFGSAASFEPLADQERVRVRVTASPMAMERWVLQYLDFTEVVKPAKLRNSIREIIEQSLEKYKS